MTLSLFLLSYRLASYPQLHEQAREARDDDRWLDPHGGFALLRLGASGLVLLVDFLG